MAYQYVREPLRIEEADQLSQACQSTEEKLIIWTLLDTGLRVSELCSLTPEHILWQQKALRVSGKGGPHGKKTKKRTSGSHVKTGPKFDRTLFCHPSSMACWS